MNTDFSTWDRANLERLVNDLMRDNRRLREEIQAILAAIDVVKGNAS